MEKSMLRLRKRPEFLVVQTGEKRRGALFLLELRQREAGKLPAAAPKFAAFATPETGSERVNQGNLPKAEAARLPRIGLTVSRKNGNSVCRSRIKRRLRAAARAAGIAELAQAQTDYVIIARPDILTADFSALTAELRRRFSPAFRHKAAAPKPRGKKANGSAAAGSGGA